VALSLLARASTAGVLVAWIDPADRFDPASAAACGAVARAAAVAARAPARGLALGRRDTASARGCSEAIVLDFAAAAPAELRRLPGSAWIRLQRRVACTRTALLAAGERARRDGAGRRARGAPGGAAALVGHGPGRLLRGLDATLAAGRHAPARASFTLHAL
jgi:hypothetical protein